MTGLISMPLLLEWPLRNSGSCGGEAGDRGWLGAEVVGWVNGSVEWGGGSTTRRETRGLKMPSGRVQTSIACKRLPLPPLPPARLVVEVDLKLLLCVVVCARQHALAALRGWEGDAKGRRQVLEGARQPAGDPMQTPKSANMTRPRLQIHRPRLHTRPPGKRA